MMQAYAALMNGKATTISNDMQQQQQQDMNEKGKKKKKKEKEQQQQQVNKKLSDFQPRVSPGERFLPVQVYAYIDEMDE
jgi:hypothetical protein